VPQPEGIKSLFSLLSSGMNSTFLIQKFTLKVFLGINIDKGIGASLVGPQPGPIPISFHSFAGLPFLGSTDCRPVTFQQLQFLVGCATVDMKMQTLVISLEMQIPDINSWRRLWERRLFLLQIAQLAKLLS
jgi:hypothetical protein